MRKENETTAADPSTELLSRIIIDGMQDRKAQNIIVLDMRGIKTAIADYFIICSGTSDTQVDAITDSVEAKVWEVLRQHPAHKEGKNNREWILLDYVDIVVHIFKKEKRNFFALEELWGDANATHIPDMPDTPLMKAIR